MQTCMHLECALEKLHLVEKKTEKKLLMVV